MKYQGDAQLPYIETFVKTAEFGSFTGAADALGLTQVAVSRRIQVLEMVLDVLLFERVGNRIMLSDAGANFREFALQIMALQREAIETVTLGKAEVTGELTLAASSTPGEYLLPGILKQFHELFPGVRIRAVVLDSRSALEQVVSGKAQVGLVGQKDNGLELDYRPFACDELLLVVPRHHAWKKRRAISFHQLTGYQFVIREPGSGSRWCFEQMLSARKHGLHDLQISLELGSNQAIKEAVRQELGVAVLSNLAIQREIDSGQLSSVRIKDWQLKRTLYVVKRSHSRVSPPAAAFLALIDSLRKSTIQA